MSKVVHKVVGAARGGARDQCELPQSCSASATVHPASFKSVLCASAHFSHLVSASLPAAVAFRQPSFLSCAAQPALGAGAGPGAGGAGSLHAWNGLDGSPVPDGASTMR